MRATSHLNLNQSTNKASSARNVVTYRKCNYSNCFVNSNQFPKYVAISVCGCHQLSTVNHNVREECFFSNFQQ